MNQEQQLAFHNLVNIACKRNSFEHVCAVFSQVSDNSAHHGTFEHVVKKFADTRDFKNDILPLFCKIEKTDYLFSGLFKEFLLHKNYDILQFVFLNAEKTFFGRVPKKHFLNKELELFGWDLNDLLCHTAKSGDQTSFQFVIDHLPFFAKDYPKSKVFSENLFSSIVCDAGVLKNHTISSLVLSLFPDDNFSEIDMMCARFSGFRASDVNTLFPFLSGAKQQNLFDRRFEFDPNYEQAKKEHYPAFCAYEDKKLLIKQVGLEERTERKQKTKL